MFISRKDGKLYVRQKMKPLFDTAVTITDPQAPIGTHLFTALDLTDNAAAMRWNVLTVTDPSAGPDSDGTNSTPGHSRKAETKRERRERTEKANAPQPSSTASAAAALDRIDIPQETAARISELLTPGSSLIVSDHGIAAGETGEGTGFVVLTR